ncbi:hypothetical protein C8J56DRAFT_138136 [Mycena floridula]|nr:hypothetical protein C8J56DRAFT_138136 [Mycena floridula]
MDISSMLRAMASCGISLDELKRNPALMGRLASVHTRQGQSAGFSETSEDIKREIEIAKEMWEKESIAPPERPVPSNRYIIQYSFQSTLDDEDHSKTAAEIRTSKTYLGNEKYYSSSQLDTLTPITLKNMLIHKVHKGQYLLCRTFVHPVRKVAIELGVEDCNGDVVFLAMYNLPGVAHANRAALRAHFPIGTLIVVREPWMKAASVGSFNPMIRVDSPSDVSFIPPDGAKVTWKTILNDPFAGSGELLKRLGNQHFRAGFTIPAVLAWSRALQVEPSLHVTLLNRSEGYLKLGWFAAALEDASQYLALTQIPSDKATFRAARAEYSLGRYESALERFRSLPDLAEAIPFILRCQERIKERSTGQFSFLGMFNEGQADLPSVDVADYMSSSIEIFVSPRGGGRGIRATKQIRTGELLVVAKPFAAAFPSDVPPNETSFALNVTTMRMSGGISLLLQSRVVMKMLGSSRDAELIYNLYAGPTRPTPSTAYPPISAEKPTVGNLLRPTIDIDMTRAEGVLSCNRFGLGPIREVTTKVISKEEDDSQFKSPTALYTTTSLFNHNCDPNAAWRCFGDVMVIRADRNIELGKEITIAYVGGSYSKRTPVLSAILGGTCDCEICEIDRTDGDATLRARQKIEDDSLKQQMANFNKTGSYLLRPKQAKAHLDKLLLTYRSPQKYFRMPLFTAQFQAMQANERAAAAQPNIYPVAIQHGFEALIAAGFTILDTKLDSLRSARFVLPLSKSKSPSGIEDQFILIMAHICACFCCIESDICAERWLRAAWWVHECAFGGGEALFNARFANALAGTPRPMNMEYRWA